MTKVMNEIKTIELSKIDSFKNHPFKVTDDDSLKELTKSIKENGLLNPLIVREKENSRYELISGHRRKEAMDLLGMTDVKVIVKDLSDDKATIEMVDSNMHRDKILPSEKAFAYKMRRDAINNKTKNKNGPQVRKEENESERNIRRYIRLTYLIPELLQLVDDTVLKDKRTALTMGIKPAVELSYLTKEEQKLVYLGITYEYVTPSHSQAIKIREYSKNKKLNFEIVESVLTEIKGIIFLKW